MSIRGRIPFVLLISAPKGVASLKGNKMKQGILLAALICAAHLAKAQTSTPREIPTPGPRLMLAEQLRPTAPAATPTPPPGVIETYKVVNGMSIRATVFNVDDGQRHRVAIVIHGGGFSAGGMETDVAQELSQFGFMGVAIEYRLAPPHTEMNTPAHPFPGQNNIHDDGY